MRMDIRPAKGFAVCDGTEVNDREVVGIIINAQHVLLEMTHRIRI